MLRRFFPTQAKFFENFQKTVDILHLTAKEFHTLLLNINNCQTHVENILVYETKGDYLAHKI